MANTNGSGTAPDVQEKAAEVFAYGEERMRALASDIVSRVQFAQLHGLTFGSKRDLYEILGYNVQLTAREYGERYARGGIAGRVVDVFPNATWRGNVDVVEDKDPHKDTDFEKAWKDLDKQHQIQAKLLRVDKLSLLSTFAVLLIGAPGDADLNMELPKARTPGKLLYLSPFSGGGGPTTRRTMQLVNRTSSFEADVSIYELDTDPKSERFGLPASYTLRRMESATSGSSGFERSVHWSRIIHVAENVLWDEVYGLPGLERVWNLLDDLEKVTGGGAEAFWLRANQGMHLNIDKDMSIPDANAAVAALKEQADDYKHQLTRWIRTRGVDVNTLGSDVANFASPADAILTQIAGAKGIPKRILTGSEMGELASSQDRDNWKDQINGRQTQYAGPYILRPLIDRLVAYGYLPEPAKGPDAYEIIWPHVQVQTEEEKATGASQWAQTNQTMGEVVFTNDEIRDHWYGFEPLKDEEKQPITAPARTSVTESVGGPPGAAAKQIAGDTIKGVPPPAKGAGPTATKVPAQLAKAGLKAAEEDELLRLLEEAILFNNTDVIDAILGTSHA